VERTEISFNYPTEIGGVQFSVNLLEV